MENLHRFLELLSPRRTKNMFSLLGPCSKPQQTKQNANLRNHLVAQSTKLDNPGKTMTKKKKKQGKPGNTNKQKESRVTSLHHSHVKIQLGVVTSSTSGNCLQLPDSQKPTQVRTVFWTVLFIPKDLQNASPTCGSRYLIVPSTTTVVVVVATFISVDGEWTIFNSEQSKTVNDHRLKSA